MFRVLEGGKQFHGIKLSKRESQYLKQAYQKDLGLINQVMFEDSRTVLSLMEKRILLRTEAGLKLHEMAKEVFISRGILADMRQAG